jgi:hypothetical protein
MNPVGLARAFADLAAWLAGLLWAACGELAAWWRGRRR